AWPTSSVPCPPTCSIPPAPSPACRGVEAEIPRPCRRVACCPLRPQGRRQTRRTPSKERAQQATHLQERRAAPPPHHRPSRAPVGGQLAARCGRKAAVKPAAHQPKSVRSKLRTCKSEERPRRRTIDHPAPL